MSGKSVATSCNRKLLTMPL